MKDFMLLKIESFFVCFKQEFDTISGVDKVNLLKFYPDTLRKILFLLSTYLSSCITDTPYVRAFSVFWCVFCVFVFMYANI